jgi:hypothetical protein
VRSTDDKNSPLTLTLIRCIIVLQRLLALYLPKDLLRYDVPQKRIPYTVPKIKSSSKGLAALCTFEDSDALCCSEGLDELYSSKD